MQSITRTTLDRASCAAQVVPDGREGMSAGPHALPIRLSTVPALGVARAEADYAHPGTRVHADGRAYAAHMLAESYGPHDLVMVAVPAGRAGELVEILRGASSRILPAG